jgi:hypothetical protein
MAQKMGEELGNGYLLQPKVQPFQAPIQYERLNTYTLR